MQTLQKFKKTTVGKIPEDWEIHNLGTISELFVPMRDKPKKFDGDIPWLRIDDLDGKFASDSKVNQRVSKEIVKKMNLRIYPVGTVLCSCSATIGVCAITTRELITNQTFIGIYPKSQLDKQFLYYYLLTQENNLRRLGSGSTIPYISREKFEKFPVIVPALKEQQKIASILSNVDELIQKTEQIIEQTQRLKKGLMQRLLTKGIGHTKFKKTELGDIPEEWQLADITHIIKDKDGIKTGPFGSSLKKEIFVSKGYKIYGQENVIPDDFTIGDYFITEEVFLKMKKYEIKPGDILISLVGTHGKVSVVPNNIQRGIINPRLLRIRLDQNKVIPLYMKILLESDYIEKQIKKLTHGLTMGILNTNTIRQFYFVIPPIAEQRKIIFLFLIINKKLENLKDYKSKNEWLKKGLMQQLLTGKIRIKV